jgi:hypothetical protein
MEDICFADITFVWRISVSLILYLYGGYLFFWYYICMEDICFADITFVWRISVLLILHLYGRYLFHWYYICMEDICFTDITFVWRTSVSLILHLYGGYLFHWYYICMEDICFFSFIGGENWRNRREKNHQPVTSHRQTLSHNVVSSTPRRELRIDSTRVK